MAGTSTILGGDLLLHHLLGDLDALVVAVGNLDLILGIEEVPRNGGGHRVKVGTHDACVNEVLHLSL